MTNPTLIPALATALATAGATRTKLAALTTEKAKLETSIASYIATGDGEDEKKLMQVAGWRVRLEMLPNVIKRVEDERGAASIALVQASEALENELVSLAT